LEGLGVPQRKFAFRKENNFLSIFTVFKNTAHQTERHERGLYPLVEAMKSGDVSLIECPPGRGVCQEVVNFVTGSCDRYRLPSPLP
jgi:hypothetical protein